MVQTAVGMEPGRVDAGRAVESQNIPPNEDLTIGLHRNGVDLGKTVVESQTRIKRGVQVTIGIEPGNSAAEGILNVGEIPPR